MGVLGLVAGAAIFSIILVIGLYIAEAIILNSLNKKMYGKGTALAWIPICNIYLLGKLTIHKIMGWILVALFFLTGNTTVAINGLKKTYSILPAGINSFVKNIYSIGVFGLFIYAIVKNVQLKNILNNGQTNDVNISKSTQTETPVQNVSVVSQMETPVQNVPVAPQMEPQVQNIPVAPQMETPVQSEPAAPQMPNQNQQNAFNMKPDNNGQN